jgi:hypothetical protein
MQPASFDFDLQVFVNCPLDAEYRPLLEALIFTVLECGLTPCLASNEVDSGLVRIEKIRRLIRSCRLSIHDISRMEPLRAGDLPRFNMPFELGLDFGCRFYGARRLNQKQCLILEQERYHYHKVLSDISGNDIRAHEGNARMLVSEVRNWIRVTTARELSSASQIWRKFNDFTGHLHASLRAAGYSAAEIDSLEVPELVQRTLGWMGSARSSPKD